MAAGLIGSVLSLLGCDPYRIEKLEEGVSTEADVRKVFGEPEAVWESPAGRVFEYNRQPAGQKNYMVTIGPDGKMAALRQVLTPENFAKVQPGMGAEELRKMLGKPASRKPYPLKNEVEWEWRWVQPPNSPMVFGAVLSAGELRVLRSGSSPDRSTEAP